MTIKDEAEALRRAIQEYDEGAPPVNKAGALLPGAKAELVAIDPVIEAATKLLEALDEQVL